MSRHSASQHPVSLLDTVWRPGIVLRPDGKPMIFSGQGKTVLPRGTPLSGPRPAPAGGNYVAHADKRSKH
jgi:hypothetical protein